LEKQAFFEVWTALNSRLAFTVENMSEFCDKKAICGTKKTKIGLLKGKKTYKNRRKVRAETFLNLGEAT
jgi:hypothetical protein